MFIERGTAARLDDLVRLNKSVQVMHVEHEPSFFRPFDETAIRDYLEKALTDPSVAFLIAVEASLAVGYAMLRVQERPEGPYTLARRHAELEHIAVEPSARGRGVGGALLDEAVSAAKQLGVDELGLSVWQFNEEAQRLFGRHGFAGYMQRMRRHAG
jgi:diamine N-acetyltransferase